MYWCDDDYGGDGDEDDDGGDDDGEILFTNTNILAVDSNHIMLTDIAMSAVRSGCD